MNNVISELNNIFYFCNPSKRDDLICHNIDETLKSFPGISLKDILSRIPELKSLYFDIFSEHAHVIDVNFKYIPAIGKLCLIIGGLNSFHDSISLKKLVMELRKTNSVLNGWTLVGAEIAYERSKLTFCPILESIDEFSDDFLVEYPPLTFNAKGDDPRLKKIFPPSTITMPMVGSSVIEVGSITLNEPFNNINFSSYSLYFLGAFILSSIVRYYPDIWCNAISGRLRISENNSEEAEKILDHTLSDKLTNGVAVIEDSDDSLLCMIKEFMTQMQEIIPSMTYRLIVANKP